MAFTVIDINNNLGFGGGGGGASVFTDLTDVPSSYTGQAGKVPAVNVGETALAFITVTTNPLSVDLNFNGFDAQNVKEITLANQAIFAGDIYYVNPSEGGAGIQSAINAAATAGGGTVQLLVGTYAVASMITWPTDANHVHLAGLGSGTVINSTVASPDYVFQASATIPAALLTKVINNPSNGNTSITTTTAADAGAFLAGMLVHIRGTDGDGFKRVEVNEVLTNGVAATGVIALKHPVKLTLTSASVTANTVGLHNSISSLKIQFTSGAANGINTVLQTYFSVEDIFLSGSAFAGGIALTIKDCLWPTVQNNNIRNFNTVSSDTVKIGPMSYGLTFKNNIIDTCVPETAGGLGSVFFESGLGNDSTEFVDNQILNSGGRGVRVGSVDLTNVEIRGNVIENARTHGIEFQGNVKDFVINGNALSFNGIRGGGGSGVKIISPAGNGIISDNICRNNFDDGVNISGASANNVIIANNRCLENVGGGLVIVSASNILIDSNHVTFGATGYGLYLESTVDVIVTNNSLSGGTRGIQSGGSNNGAIISANTARNNSTNSILLLATDSNFTITSNNFRSGTIALSTGTGHLYSLNQE